MFINVFARTVLGVSETIIARPDMMKLISLPMAAEYFFIKRAQYLNPDSTITVPVLKNNTGYDFMIGNVCHEVKSYMGFSPKDRPNAIVLNVSKMNNKKGSYLSCIFDVPNSDISFIAFDIPPSVWERSMIDSGLISMRARYIDNELTLIHDKNPDMLSYFNPFTENQLETILQDIHQKA